jgi:hypothetical protein
MMYWYPMTKRRGWGTKEKRRGERRKGGERIE